MTYKLNLIIEKIDSPVVLVLPNGEKREYKSGSEVFVDVVDRRYVIESFRDVENTVEVRLKEAVLAGTNWNGEEQTFF